MDNLDKDSIVPLYEQLAAALRERIRDGTYTGRIPSEVDLAEEFDVSRPTARRAVRVLVDEGLVGISRGRGAFVLKARRRR